MSKKRLSQIIGLTIGASAIMTAGVASSLALTSCTSSNTYELSPVNLSDEDLTTLFGAINTQISNTNYVPPVEGATTSSTDATLNSDINVLATKQAITNALPQLSPNDITDIKFTTSSQTVDNSLVILNGDVSVSVTFNNNVTLPETSANYGIESQTVTDSNVAVLTNGSIVTINNDATQPIFNAISSSYDIYGVDVKSDPEFLSTDPSVQNALKGCIIGAVNQSETVSRASNATPLTPANILGISFDVQTPSRTNDSKDLNLGFSINFDNNVNLANIASDSLFTVDGQSLICNQTLTTTNPSYTSFVLTGGYASTILSCIQTKLQSVSSGDFNLDHFNGPDFQSQLKRDIIDSGVPLNPTVFSVNFNNLTNDDVNSPLASVGVTLNFQDNVELKDWNSNNPFSSNGNSLTLKQPLEVKNPTFNKIEISPNKASLIYSAIETAIKAKIKDVPQWTLDTFNDQSFIDSTIKPAIINNSGVKDALKPDYITSVNFTSNTNPFDNAKSDINYTISFDDNVSLNNWPNNNPVYSISNNKHTLGTKNSIQVDNPDFKPIEIQASNADAIYESVKNVINNQIQGDKAHSWTQDDLNTTTFKNQAILAFMQAAHVDNYQPIDVTDIYFNVTPVADNPSYVNISYNITFGKNVKLVGNWDATGKYKMPGKSTLYSVGYQVLNPQYVAPETPVINNDGALAILDTIKQSLNGLPQSQINSSLATNSLVIDGLVGQIVKQLNNPAYNTQNFSTSSIQSIELEVSAPDSTNNNVTISPTIVFSPDVKFSDVTPDGFSIGVDGDSSTFSCSVTRTGSGAFLTSTGVHTVADTINQYLTDLAAKTPNQLNPSYLNSSLVTNQLINSIVQNSGFKGSNITSDNLALSFTATQASNSCQVAVSYQLSFTDTTFASNLGNKLDNLTISDNKLTSDSTNYQNYVLNSDMVGFIYQTIDDKIQTLVKAHKFSELTPDNLNGAIKQQIINDVNTTLQPKEGDVISNLTFSVNPNNNLVSASVQFGTNFVVVGDLNVNNVMSTSTKNQYQMNFTAPGFSDYTNNSINNASIDTLDKTVAAWVTAQGMQAIADQSLNNNKGDLSAQLSQAGFNPNWLDWDKTNFTITFGKTNTVVFNAVFNENIQDQDVTNTNNGYVHDTHTFTKTCSTAESLGYVMTQARYDAIKATVTKKVNEIYTKLYNGGNGSLNNFQAELMQQGKNDNGNNRYLVSDAIYQEVMNNTGLITLGENAGMGAIWFTVANNYSANQVDVSYEYTARNTNMSNGVDQGHVYYVPSNLSLGEGCTKSLRNSGGDWETLFHQDLSPKDSIQTTPVTDANLTSILNAVQTTINKNVYQRTLNYQSNYKLSASAINSQVDNVKTAIASACPDLSNYISSISFTNVSDSNPGVINSGDLNFTLTLNKDKVRFNELSTGSALSFDPTTGTLSTKQPVSCGTGLYQFNGTTLTGLTAQGAQASSLVLGSYVIDNINQGAFLSSAAQTMDFRNCDFNNNTMPQIFAGNNYDGSLHNPNLTTFYLPAYAELPVNMFAGCQSLTGVAGLLDESQDITNLPDGVIRNCPKWKTILIPDDATFGNNSFVGCTGVETLDMGQAYNLTLNQVVNLVKQVQTTNSCPSRLILPSNVDLGQNDGPLSNALQDYGYPFDLVITNENISIPSSYFDSIKIRSITAKNVLDVGSYAFQNCIYLQEFICNKDSGIRTVGSFAFQGCSNLKTCSFLNWDNFNLETISSSAFANCTSLENISFPMNIHTIGSFAFQCAAIKLDPFAIQNNQIALNSLTTLAGYAFDQTLFLATNVNGTYGPYMKDIIGSNVGVNWHSKNGQICPWGNGSLWAPDNILRAQANLGPGKDVNNQMVI